MTTHSVQPTATTQPLRRDLRAALAPGLLTIIAGAVQGDGAIITAAYRNASPISDEQLSYPWAGATAITTSLIWGVTQVLIVVGLMAFARSGAAPTTAGRVGGRLAVAGAALYVVAHALSLVAYDARSRRPDLCRRAVVLRRRHAAHRGRPDHGRHGDSYGRESGRAGAVTRRSSSESGWSR